METFLDRIEAIARKRHWKLPQLEEESGVKAATMRGWRNRLKNGEMIDPGVGLILKIAEILNTTVEYIMTGKEIKRKQEYNDPVKGFLVEYIDGIDDHDELIEIRAAIKMLNSMVLKPRGGIKKGA